MPNENSPSFIPGRRWSIGLSVLVSCAALVAIVIMVNYLGAKNFTRLQWAKETRHQLSPMTGRLLNSLEDNVRVIVFFDRGEALYSSVSELITQYQLASSRLEVEFVDYLFKPGRGEEIRSEFGMIHAPYSNCVIFHANGKTRVVHERELSVYDTSGMLEGKEIKRVAFRGEQLFTSAIYSVIDTKDPKAYFLEGHGEHDFEQTDNYGFSKFAQLLEEYNITSHRLSLLDSEVPADCSLLVIAAPIHALSSDELDQVERYLNQGGRLFVLFNAHGLERRTGLERVLAKWGVEVSRNIVVDAPQARVGDDGVVYAAQFGRHPIVTPLVRPQFRLALLMPRSISLIPSVPQTADAPKVEELFFTGEEGLARSAFDAPRTGRLSLAAAVEKGGIQGISADRGATRIVVTGDSYFISNALIDGVANREFAHLAVNWLLNRDLLIEEIGPRPVREYQVSLTNSQMQGMRWLLLAGFPGGMLLLGMVVWFRRRS